MFSSRLYCSRPVGVAVLGLALLVGFGAMVSHARTNDDNGLPTGGSIAMVDMERIYNASNAPVELAQKAQEIEGQAQSRIDSIAAVTQLSLAELKEYGDLVALNKPDEKQQKRMMELKDLSDRRVDQYVELQKKPDAQLTPKDKMDLQTFRQQSHLLEKIMPGLQADLRQDVLEREDAVKRSLIAQLRTEVANVAKEKKIAHVFDAGALVYSANDLTAAVIQKVGRKNK